MGGGEASSPQEPASRLAVSSSPRVPSSGVSTRDRQDWGCKGVLGREAGRPSRPEAAQEVRAGRSRGGAEV